MSTHASGARNDPADRQAVLRELARRLHLTPADTIADFARHGIEITGDRAVDELMSLRARMDWASENWPQE